MSFEIVLKSDRVIYQLGEKSFSTDKIEKIDSNKFHEPGVYKEPESTVIEEIYQANSERGIFKWKVRACRHGYDGYASIDDIFLISSPDPRIEADDPSFVVNEVEEDE